MVHEFASQIVNKLALAINSDGETLRVIISQLCTPDFYVTKKVVNGEQVSNSFADDVKWSNSEEFVNHMEKMEKVLPDLHFAVDSFKDYANRSGLVIKCEFKYKGTMVENRPSSPPSSSSSNSSTSGGGAFHIELCPDKLSSSSDNSDNNSTTAGIPYDCGNNALLSNETASKALHPSCYEKIHCVGTLYIYLNNDNKITHLEFVCQYM
jgi:hypothetical protein